jgi:PAP2 superfamily
MILTARTAESSWAGHLKAGVTSKLDLVATGLLLLLLIPAFLRSGLPPRINWSGFLAAYWGLSWRSVCIAALLLTLVSPLQVVSDLWQRYWNQKARLPVLAVFAAAMFGEFGWVLGFMVIVNGIAAAEWFDRAKGDLDLLKRDAINVAVPAVYFFCGLALMFCYNAIIVTMEYPGTYDAAFNKLDAMLLGGMTVSKLVHLAAQELPLGVFKCSEFIYYEIFGQIGAAVIILAMLRGRQRAIEFVGSLLMAIYLALLIFSVWPSIGPFAADPALPQALGTYHIQRLNLLAARARWNHWYLPMITTEEYIAFPSLHIALPVIVLWFLRHWKRITFVLLFYDVFLLLSIVLLEWHYVVDLIGGMLIAALAIYLVDVDMNCRRSSPS